MRIRLATVGKALAATAMVALAVLIAISRSGPPSRVTPSTVTQPATHEAAAEPDCGGKERLIVPVQGITRAGLVDTFGEARSEGRRHDAIDILAPRGTPVLAAAAGRVEKLFQSRAGGNTAYVRSSDGRMTYYYAHLDRYAAGLREGATVDRGTSIGAVGSTGNADPATPHLHFAIMETNPARRWWEAVRVLNPYPLLASGGDCHRPR